MATFGGAVNASADLVDRFGKAVADLAPALVKATRGLTDHAAREAARAAVREALGLPVGA